LTLGFLPRHRATPKGGDRERGVTYARRVRRIVVALVVWWALGPVPAGAELLVTVGEVTADTAVVWGRAGSDGTLTVEWEGAGGEVEGSASVEVGAETDLTGKIRLTGLRAWARYAYRLRSGEDVVDGDFVTAPGADEARPVRFVWSGDLGGGGHCRRPDTGYPIFEAMTERRPDFFLFVGDTMYADSRCRAGTVPGSDFIATTLPGYRAKHRYNREDRAVQRFFRTTSVYAIWDDHEVRNDFSGTVEPLMPVGRQAFLEYWPILPPPDDPGRLYRSFRWGRLLEVFILDTRQYRSPNAAPDGPGKTMLGERQRRWLLQAVAASPATWKVVVSSVSLSVPSGRPRDGWSGATIWGLPEAGWGFATERDAILKSLADQGVRNLLFVVADVHHAELVHHRPWPDFTLYELIAGPLSATLGRPRPLDLGLAPQSLFAYAGSYNFGEVLVTEDGVTVRFFDETGRRLFTEALGVR
jgi:alkaline phosphatase D